MRAKSILAYSDSTETIRQFPENYLIAYRDSQCWHMDPDLAADEDLVVRVTVALLKYENKYQIDGLKLLAEMTRNSSFDKSIKG